MAEDEGNYYVENQYGLCPSWALALGYMGVASGAVLSNWGSAVSSRSCVRAALAEDAVHASWPALMLTNITIRSSTRVQRMTRCICWPLTSKILEFWLRCGAVDRNVNASRPHSAKPTSNRPLTTGGYVILRGCRRLFRPLSRNRGGEWSLRLLESTRLTRTKDSMWRALLYSA